MPANALRLFTVLHHGEDVVALRRIHTVHYRRTEAMSKLKNEKGRGRKIEEVKRRKKSRAKLSYQSVCNDSIMNQERKDIINKIYKYRCERKERTLCN